MANNSTYNKELTLEEWQEMKRAERDNLFNDINNTAVSVVEDPEKLRGFLDVQSRNNRYSVANCLTLLKHCPNASKLRTFDDWTADNSFNKFNNVYLKRNQKNIPILEPYDYQKEDGTKGVGYNIKKMFDVSQTTAKGEPAPTRNDNPQEIIRILIQTSPVLVKVAEELPDPNMGAFYNNEKQTLFIQKDLGDSVTIFRCLTRELAHAELSIKSDDVYSRKDSEFQANCAAYMMCRKYGVYAKNLGIENIPEDWKGMEPKEIRGKLDKIRYSMNEIHKRVFDEIYREEKEHNKEQKSPPKQEQAR